MALLRDSIQACKICEEHLPLGCKPIVQFSTKSKIALIGQAPGTKVHHSGIPWDDASGDRMRKWLGVSRTEFYDPDLFALVPMGFCYPGKGPSGDLPPRKECAIEWHDKIEEQFERLEMTLLVGRYAHNYYLGNRAAPTMTETVRNFREYLPTFCVLPHSSPRNNIWLSKNPWFTETVLPQMRLIIKGIRDL